MQNFGYNSYPWFLEVAKCKRNRYIRGFNPLFTVVKKHKILVITITPGKVTEYKKKEKETDILWGSIIFLF